METTNNLAEKPCFSVVHGDMVQILNTGTHPQSGWVVHIYDSAGGFVV